MFSYTFGIHSMDIILSVTVRLLLKITPVEDWGCSSVVARTEFDHFKNK